MNDKINIEYKNKYLKYRNKYLKYKNKYCSTKIQKGGDAGYIILSALIGAILSPIGISLWNYFAKKPFPFIIRHHSELDVDELNRMNDCNPDRDIFPTYLNIRKYMKYMIKYKANGPKYNSHK